MTCKLCNRKLSLPSDPLSEDLGGDCAACMLEVEIEVGDFRTAAQIGKRIVDHLLRLEKQS